LARSKAELIALREIDQLAIEGGGALPGGIERTLEGVDRPGASLPRS
jgi:hypothetical protein